jgi:hypothetical protein
MTIFLINNKIPFSAILFFLIISSSIPSRSSWAANVAKGRPAAKTETFVTYRYVDPMTNMEVFHLLVPKGWRVEGSVAWSPNPALPAQSRFRFFNPRGSEELNFFPTQSYFWTNNRLFLATNPPGTFRFGTQVARPVGLRNAFSDFIIPGAKRSMRGMTVVKEKEVPELAALAIGLPERGVKASAEAGKMRIVYAERGGQMEEEFYAAVSQFVTQLPGSGYSSGYFIDYWYIDYAFSFRDEKGKLDSRSRTFQTMIYSLKVNPRWFAKVVNVREQLAQSYIKGIKSVGRMGQMISQAGSQMREDQQRGWEQRQQANDKIVQNFSDHIRGVERYNDPRAGKEVELPAGYGNAWANNLGEYIVTESPGYNPNIESNQHWEQLTPAK